MRGLSASSLNAKQRDLWMLSGAAIKWLADTGYLRRGYIAIRGTDGWWATNAQQQGSRLEWLGPRRISYEQEPAWQWLLEVSMSAPVPYALLESLGWLFEGSEVELPNLLLRNGWCRAPLNASDVEVAIYAAHSDMTTNRVY